MHDIVIQGGLVFDGTGSAEAAAGAPPLARSPRLNEPRWTPDRVDSARWPARIRWHVDVYRGTGGADIADSEFAFAERSAD